MTCPQASVLGPLVLVNFLFVSSVLIPASRVATDTVAEMLLEFVHACTPRQCRVLRAIVESPTATEHERLLARALLRVEHMPHPTDRSQLQSLIADDRADRGERTVAGAILRLVHTASDADKTQLRRLLDSRKKS
jgi:hypothetical protein